MGYGRVTSSMAHFQRNMAFPGGMLSALFMFFIIFVKQIYRMGYGRCIKTGERPRGRGQVISSLWVPAWSGLLEATSHGAPSSANIRRLIVQDFPVQLFLWLPWHVPFWPLSPASKHCVSLTFYEYGRSRSSQLISQIHCSAKFPTLTLSNAPCISFTPLHSEIGEKKTIFILDLMVKIVINFYWLLMRRRVLHWILYLR